ncbi:MAG: NAD+ synthase [Verrucomicrobiota bacterium]|nr:NAD+ synthase [Verrucomicrobiota bacterium]
MRLGLAQINTTVGDFAGNRRKILEAYAALVRQGAQLVVFPELVVCGYPPRDLLFKHRFVTDGESSLTEIAAAIDEVPALIGFPETNTSGQGRPYYNAAAFCHRGEVQLVARKCLLPTYDVFDEDRYFEPAPAPRVVEFNGKKIGITICEDIWTHPSILTRRLYHGLDPVRQLAARHCDLMVNLSASPWHHGKGPVRRTLVTDSARTLGCPVAYINAIGGNDELVFDGHSLVADAKGQILAQLAAFSEELRVVDTSSTKLETQNSQLSTDESPGDIFAALVLGLRDYAHKSGFKSGLVALSGGIDSAVVGVIAAAAFGPENVIGVSLPSAISSPHSRDDARALAQNLGLRFETIAIAEAVAACEAALGPLFASRARDITEENIQARVRGVLMMALSNKFGALLLTTGNKSEVAVGYCTLYGDMAGGLAVISDVFKTQIYALARWINDDARAHGRQPPIPQSSIDKPPSAELRPGQLDQDSLPPYDVLDAILHGYVEEGLSRRDLIAQDFAETVVNDVVRKVDLNEYKRKQAAPGLKITPLAFGVGRRIPIVQKYVS